ncbi:hypothetical protein [Streptomyces sp. PSAA01]|uniref:hypothetical protein n=1 Tax=Streptomyces sp. PSAA01 TaxID=2912762 RepID=UPI001F349FB7|nr:hypothetical protein [Streptomyces sp. PSAA01]MCG0283558.1 hypothetical protein [Streptomyces sp. PSAA01]
MVHTSVAGRFVEQLVGEVRSLVVGEPTAGEDVEAPWCPRHTLDDYARTKHLMHNHAR